MYERIIIVDDDNIKVKKIAKYLGNNGRQFEIIRFSNARDIMLYFRDNKNDDFSNTLLFLDWLFPFRPGDYVDKNGDLVLHEIMRQGVKINVVIVSSDVVEVSGVDFVKGSIKYNYQYQQQEEFDKYLV